MAVPGKGFDGPLDPVPPKDDFEEPNVKTGSEAAAVLSESPEQLQLDGVPAAETPKVIRDGKMLAEFVRPHFEKEEDARFVGFEFSFPLTADHEKDGHLPAKVLKQWAHMREGDVTLMKVEGVDNQTIAVGLVPGDPENDLILVGAAIAMPTLAKVQEKGSGKTQKVIRFSFRAVVDQTENVAKFAVDHHGDQVWISIQRTSTQGSLLE